VTAGDEMIISGVGLDAETLAGLLDASPLGMSVLDRDLAFVYVNEAMAGLHGVPRAEHAARPLHDVLPAVDVAIAAGLLRVIELGQVVADIPMAAPLPGDASRTGHWRMSLFPIRDRAGAVIGAGVSAREVTEAVEAALARDAAEAGQAELLAEQRNVALTLQRALLPQPVSRPDLLLAVRYVPGVAGLEVGGDFYDVFDLHDGCVGVVVGDVMGSGLRAAALMGQVRAGLRAITRLPLGPAQVLTLLDELVADLEPNAIVTCLYGVLDTATRTFTYARAGHLPFQVRLADGSVSTEHTEGTDAEVVGPPLGVRGSQQQTALTIPAGATVAFYTDGLVEDRTRDIDAGLTELRQALSTGPDGLEPLADHVLAKLGRAKGHDDDVALLLVRQL